MYPYYIEVHTKDDAIPITINLDQIVGFGADRDEGTAFRMADKSLWLAKESYDDVKTMMHAAGCQIDKGDPRLDNTLLSWDDITRLEMIGEPLYNSNTRKWMLMIDIAGDRAWIELINDAGGHEKWIEHDLQKFPLYRMKHGL